MLRIKHVPVNEKDNPAEYEPRADETLGAYLRRVRVLRGISLPEVARALASAASSPHISSRYLSQIEFEQILQPTDESLQRLAHILQVKPEWLLEKARQPRQREPSPLRVCVRTGEQNLAPDDQKLFLQMIKQVLSHRHNSRAETARTTGDIPGEKEL